MVHFLPSPTGGARRVSAEAGRGEEHQTENQLSSGGGTRIPSYSVGKMNSNMSESNVNMYLPVAGIGERAFAQSESIPV